MLIVPPALHAAGALLRTLVDSLTSVVSIEPLPEGAETPLPRANQPNDTALLQYTSGITRGVLALIDAGSAARRHG